MNPDQLFALGTLIFLAAIGATGWALFVELTGGRK